MDSANVLDFFTCGICLETFDESSKCPRMLSCGHSFCHSCLGKLVAQSPYCPTCKAEILFQTTETIPINFSLGIQIFMLNTSTNLEGGISNTTQTGGPAKCEPRTSNCKYLSEGYCDEHETYKGMRCMDCNVWICGMCGMLHHQHCRTLVVEEAYKELKKRVSQRVEEELGQRKTKTERLTDSLRVLEEERISLIELIKRNKLKLKECEKRIQELESLKAEENKFCYQLKQLQTKVDNFVNYAEFSRTFKELEKMMQKVKTQIPVELPLCHLPQTPESLGTLCRNRSVYAVEDRYDGTKYGKVALKDGRIFVASCQQEKPEDAALFSLPELLFRFNNGSSELPKTAFLRVTPDGGRDEFFEVLIETDGLTPRAKNLTMLCSALKSPSFKGLAMYGDYGCYYDVPAPSPPIVEGIRNDDPMTPRKGGVVYGMWEGSSRFLIELKDQLCFSLPKIGVVVAGLQQLKDLRGRKILIEECGLVI